MRGQRAAGEPRPARPIIEIVLVQHLTVEAISTALATAEQDIPAAGRADVLVDSLAMTGYDVGARAVFVEWNTRMRGSVTRLAIITDRAMWRLVVGGMALASGQNMKAFANRAEAMDWLASER